MVLAPYTIQPYACARQRARDCDRSSETRFIVLTKFRYLRYTSVSCQNAGTGQRKGNQIIEVLGALGTEGCFHVAIVAPEFGCTLLQFCTRVTSDSSCSTIHINPHIPTICFTRCLELTRQNHTEYLSYLSKMKRLRRTVIVLL
jgi:hypothetical protein